MTAPRASMRQRRRTSATIPAPVVAWFRGERDRAPWAAMAFPGWALLPGWWQAWKADHPEAAPPAGYAWLNDPADRRNHPPAFVMASARSGLRKG